MSYAVKEIELGWAAKKLQRRAAAVSIAQSRFEIAVIGAHKNGMSLREIAAATHVSHEQVRQIILRAD